MTVSDPQSRLKIASKIIQEALVNGVHGITCKTYIGEPCTCWMNLAQEFLFDLVEVQPMVVDISVTCDRRKCAKCGHERRDHANTKTPVCSIVECQCMEWVDPEN